MSDPFSGVIGKSLLALGVLLFLFVGYQLWGTGKASRHPAGGRRPLLISRELTDRTRCPRYRPL